MTTIVQIVPRRAVIPDGIGDFATKLAEGLRANHAIESVFLQGTAAAVAEPRNDGWRTIAVAAQDATNLQTCLRALVTETRPAAILLHVSGYGYQRRGVPDWLADGLSQFPSAADRRRLPLLGYFHELWVHTPQKPWTSSFWLAGRQRAVARRLFGLCDRALTTNDTYRCMLQDLPEAAGKAAIDVLPVFSNVGEPETVPVFGARPARLAVFAGQGTAGLVRNHETALARFLRANAIAEIVDIGGRGEPQPRAIDGVAVRTLGRLEAAEVSAELRHCRFGAMSYAERAVLGKSGTLAAYAAHGVVPVAFDPQGKDADGLVTNRHYLVAGVQVASDPERIAADIRHWYADHAVAAHAAAVALMLRGATAWAA